ANIVVTICASLLISLVFVIFLGNPNDNKVFWILFGATPALELALLVKLSIHFAKRESYSSFFTYLAVLLFLPIILLPVTIIIPPDILAYVIDKFMHVCSLLSLKALAHQSHDLV